MANTAGSGVMMLAKGTAPSDVDVWVTSMFQKADTNSDEYLSFEEFTSFLKKEAKEEAEDVKKNLREAVLSLAVRSVWYQVAQNIERNHGGIHVVQKSGA